MYPNETLHLQRGICLLPIYFDSVICIRPVKLENQAMIVPSVYFNRVTGGNRSNSVNSLTLQSGLNWERNTDPDFVFNSLRIFPSYATDFDLETHIRAVEVHSEPLLYERF